MNIQDQQQFYLDTIYRYFHENATWPTYRYIDKKLFNEMGIDAKEVSVSLPNGFANSFRFDNNFSDQATLSLEAIRMCDGSGGDLKDFLIAVRFMVELYKQAEEDYPPVTNADLKNQLHMTDDVIARVGKLLAGETILSRSSSMSLDGSETWNYKLDREIRRFGGVTSIEDYLERRNRQSITALQETTNQLKSFLGYMYRKPGSDDADMGMAAWVKNLTEPNEETGVKLEVALLNALARLGVPILFGGDIQRIEPKSGGRKQSGPATPVFDLVAVTFGGPMHLPTAVLISCKSTNKQPDRIEIALLANESQKVRGLLSGWLVFGVMVNLGEPTADEFNHRQDVRIWKQSDLQALLNAKEYQSIAQFLWTPPWNWNRDTETMWQNIYR